MFRKTFVLLAIALVLFSPNLWAEETETPKVSGFVIPMTNIIDRDSGKDSLTYEMYAYFTTGKLGLGINVDSHPDENYLMIKPYTTWKIWQGIDFVGGLSTNSLGQDHIHGGPWYFGRWNKLSLFVDPRFYFEISEEAKSFFDGFVKIDYHLTEKFAFGIEGFYDRWWKSGNEWLLVGLVPSYKINESVSAFSRIARETDLEGINGTNIRLGVKWRF